LLGGLRKLNIYTDGVANACKDFFQPEFLRKRV
jgi:hypothetical protein